LKNSSWSSPKGWQGHCHDTLLERRWCQPWKKTLSYSDHLWSRAALGRFAAYDCLTSEGSPSHCTQIRPTVYSGISTTPLMTFLPVAYKGRLWASFPVHITRKRTSEKFPLPSLEPMIAVSVCKIRSRRTKPLRHRATSAHFHDVNHDCCLMRSAAVYCSFNIIFYQKIQ